VLSWSGTRSYVACYTLTTPIVAAAVPEALNEAGHTSEGARSAVE
jgi:hypothetical protein